MYIPVALAITPSIKRYLAEIYLPLSIKMTPSSSGNGEARVIIPTTFRNIFDVRNGILLQIETNHPSFEKPSSSLENPNFSKNFKMETSAIPAPIPPMIANRMGLYALAKIKKAPVPTLAVNEYVYIAPEIKIPNIDNFERMFSIII